MATSERVLLIFILINDYHRHYHCHHHHHNYSLVNGGPNIQCRVGMMQDERKFKGGMWDGQELAGSRKFVCLILARWEQLRL